MRRSVPSVTMKIPRRLSRNGSTFWGSLHMGWRKVQEVERFEPRFEGFQRQKFEVVEGSRRFARFCKGV